MSTTIEDKINLFANVIFEKVEKQSEEKFAQAKKQIEDHYSAEKEKIEAIARQVAEDKVKKSDTMCTQILSRARMEAKQSLFQKRDELLNRTMGDIRDRAREFVTAPEYANFLQNAICRTISGLEGEQALLISLTSDDLRNHADLIRKTVTDCLADSGVVYTLHEAEDDMIGGCSCTNEQMTKRSVYTIASLLEDNKDRIGQIVMENLQFQVVL